MRHSANVTNITSYNRGELQRWPGGVNLPPSPAELAALRQPRLPELRVQQQNGVAAGADRAQFVAVNRGRPGSRAAGPDLHTLQAESVKHEKQRSNNKDHSEDTNSSTRSPS
jgi:hypothetical protein